MKYQIVVFALLVAGSLTESGCKDKTSAPSATNQYHYEIEMTILPYDSLGALGGLGFYVKPITRNQVFSPVRGDTIVRMLLDSNFAVTEYLYPAELGLCRDPLSGAVEIVKLEQSDTAIYRFGYATLDSVFAPLCIPHWRQYNVIRVGGGA